MSAMRQLIRKRLITIHESTRKMIKYTLRIQFARYEEGTSELLKFIFVHPGHTNIAHALRDLKCFKVNDNLAILL